MKLTIGILIFASLFIILLIVFNIKHAIGLVEIEEV